MSEAQDFRAEVYYKYRRQNICCGMTVRAVDVDDAMEQARSRITDNYPAAKISAVSVTEETAK
jgi:hypothetical protein